MATATARCFGSVPAAPTRPLLLCRLPRRWSRSSRRAGAGQRQQFLRDDPVRRDEHQLRRGCGTVFQISPSGTYTNLYSFAGPPSDGSYPASRAGAGQRRQFLRDDRRGRDATATGTVFRISPSGTYTNLYSFAGAPNDGAGPEAGLVQGSDGNFYGTTLYGGNNGDGTVFRISPSGSYTNLYSFAGSPTDGPNPLCRAGAGQRRQFLRDDPLRRDSNGDGTVFELAFVSGNTNCTFSIGSTNAVFDAAGGSEQRQRDRVQWLHVDGHQQRQLHYHHRGHQWRRQRHGQLQRRANTSTNILTGTMTIAGQTFTVTQSAHPSSRQLHLHAERDERHARGQGRLEKRERESPRVPTANGRP